ncbi:MFS-type transporter SLC18B1-like [Paramacrobiotus metropolitanus]|uniref:MFS-type transporter SLC18B1-like n=1 Tax=Paramacrobiotus metropolitanus TaxID=2943436 RepID=UPI002445637E|nr:MFS-type transporter SLC18B1-like [Paramacrobiotus metropolitanus]XP_055353346.1 MFS-type transporter SLC18B1-like [Paramacrobiotus metropolitanus]
MPLSVANSFRSRRYSVRSSAGSRAGEPKCEVMQDDSITRAALQALSYRQKVVIILGAAAQTLQYFAESMVPLLLPPEAIAKGISHIQYGIIMAVTPLMFGLVDPFTCYIVPIVGIKPGFVGSTLVAGAGYLSFGLLHWSVHETVFFICATIIRFILGINFAVTIIVGLAMMCLILGESAGLGFAIGTFAEGFGYTLGPLIAGPVAEMTGFAAPFVLAGSFMCILSIVSLLILEKQLVSAESVKFRWRDIIDLLRDRLVIACSIILAISSFTWMMVEATLEQHLAEYEYGLTVEGMIFTLSNASYGLTAPLWGYLGKKEKFALYSVLFSPFLGALANIFLGPVPGLEALDGHLGLDIACLVVVRISMSIAIVGSSLVMLQQAESQGLEHNVATFALIGALWYTPYCFGEVIGTISGSHIFATKGFSMLTLVNVVFLLVGGIISLLVAICSRDRRHYIVNLHWPLAFLSRSFGNFTRSPKTLREQDLKMWNGQKPLSVSSNFKSSKVNYGAISADIDS